MLKTNEIYLGDCLEVMKDIDDGSVDLVVTDPPYKIISGGCRKKKQQNDCSGVFNRYYDNKRTDWVDEVRTGKMFKENDIKFSDWIKECYRVLKKDTHIYVMCNDRNMYDLLDALQQSGLKLVNILIWKKNNVTPNKFYMKNCEFIVMARKGGQRWINNRGTKQCLEIPNIKGKKQHPTEKPVDLMNILIENSSNEGEIVLDPFVGAGSTCISAKGLRRKYIGIEKDENYFNIAKERIQSHSKQIEF